MLRTIFFIPQVLSAVIVSFVWKIILVDRGLLNIVLHQLGLIEKNIHWLGDPKIAFYSVVLLSPGNSLVSVPSFIWRRYRAFPRIF
jgi:putative chitobiose transport system permease protein